MTGVKSFSQGISGNSLGSSATGARGALDATAVRRLDIVRNVSENMIKPLLRKWMGYNAEFLDEEQVMRITNEEFVTIKKDDLMGQIDIDIEVSTSEDNSAKAQELSFMLQTTAQGMDPGLHNVILAEIARLHKMPDLAKRIENFQPQPDPYAEQIKQLEMSKLQAEIAERQSRAQENGVDMQVKSAKANLDQAKARATHSSADMTDLNFLEKESGADKMHEMEKMDFQQRGAMDQQAMSNMHKDGLAKMKPKK
jgi:hypothetical protein